MSLNLQLNYDELSRLLDLLPFLNNIKEVSLLSDIETNLLETDEKFKQELAMLEKQCRSEIQVVEVTNCHKRKKEKDYDSSSSPTCLKKRKRSKFTKEDKEVLINWLKEHEDYPYPNENEKQMLLERVGMTKEQLETWFVNNRKRLLPGKKSRKTPAMLECEKFKQKLVEKMAVETPSPTLHNISQ
ncbi:hypothetical protein ABK040_015162 [Willaertia magna]